MQNAKTASHAVRPPREQFSCHKLSGKMLDSLFPKKNRGMTLFCRGSPSRILVQISTNIFRTKVLSMPIRVTCQCGQSLNVPDSMAGKSGKCPKCKQMIQIPNAAAGAVAAVKSSTTQKPAKSASASQPLAASNMAGLLDAAGLVQKTGMFCPNCDQPSRPGTVLCTHCGFNFTEGSKVDGHKSAEKKQFGNKQLNEAAAMMVREESTQTRMLSSGTPWWMMFASLTGLLLFVGGALIKKDASTSGSISPIPFMARIQNADWLPVMGASAGAGLLLIAVFAYIALIFTAFFDSRKQGLLCLFVPLYIVYYMFSRIKSQKLLSTVIIIWVTSILAGALLGYALPKI